MKEKSMIVSRLRAAAIAGLICAFLGGCAAAPSSGLSGRQTASLLPQSYSHTSWSTIINFHRRTKTVPSRSFPAVKSWMAPATAVKSLLYVSDPVENVVNVYDESATNQAPIGQIGGLSEPQAMWVDPHANLWVANTTAFTVLAYHRGSIFSYKTLSDPNGYPAGVCGDNATGTIYATDIQSSSGGNGTTIDVYAGGATTPTSLLNEPNSLSLYFCAVDAKSNLFVSYVNASTSLGEVDEFPKGQTTPIAIVSNLTCPGGVALDRYNALVVDDPCGQAMYIYDPPYTNGSYYSFTYSGAIQQIALDRSETNLWGADQTNDTAQEFSYPHGVFRNKTSSSELTLPTGAEVSPP